MEEPPPDAYGRVTNPERFMALWPVADRLIEQLSSDYNVQREERPDLDEELAHGVTGGVQRAVRITPASGHAAPIVIAFTGFPGLRVRFGRWHIESFPGCGCDACDEDPEAEAQLLAEQVQAVTAGQFEEAVTMTPEPGISYSFSRDRRGGWSSVTAEVAQTLGAPVSIQWRLWPRA